MFGTGNSVTISLDWVFNGSQTVTVEPENGPQPLSLDIANPSNPVCNGNTPPCVTYGPGNLLTVSQQPVDGVTIQISDSQIIIINDLPGVAFCASGAGPCPSEFWAFDFQFSPAINLTAPALGAATSSDFQPTGLGLQLLSSTEVRVQVTGDAPAGNSELIIDLFPAGAETPEPASVLLTGAALGGLALATRLQSRASRR